MLSGPIVTEASVGTAVLREGERRPHFDQNPAIALSFQGILRLVATQGPLLKLNSATPIDVPRFSITATWLTSPYLRSTNPPIVGVLFPLRSSAFVPRGMATPSPLAPLIQLHSVVSDGFVAYTTSPTVRAITGLSATFADATNGMRHKSVIISFAISRSLEECQNLSPDQRND